MPTMPKVHVPTMVVSLVVLALVFFVFHWIAHRK